MPRTLYCFIIGPMGEAEGIGSRARLRRLKDHIVRPVLEDITGGTSDRYDVRTPFDLGIEGGASIIRDVIYNIDRADIVVADLTNGNPNVFYELGITHALGRPCVTVLQEGQPIQFDINAYRVSKVDLHMDADYAANDNAYAQAQRTLFPALKAAHAATGDWSTLENPVIDYYHAPMTFVSPAPALAEGYFTNFVLPVVEALTQRKASRYFYDIGVADAAEDEPGKIEDTRLLSREERGQLDLHVVVPKRIDRAKRYYANKLRGQAQHALVETSGRTLTMWAYTTADGLLHLLDVPTTLRGVESAVERRMRFPGVSHDTDEWRDVEKQEVDRFLVMLQRSIASRIDADEEQQRVLLLRPDRLDEDKQGWLRKILD